MRCNGLERCVATRCAAGAPVACDDSNECTTDACAESGPMMCTSTAIAGCRRVAVQSGNYTLTPRLMHQCQDELFKETVLDLNVASVRIDANAASTTVAGMPALLGGGPVTGGRFSVLGTIPGMCITTLTLSGSFTDETHFTGQLALGFVGPWCQVTNCEARNITVSGARAP